MEYNVRIELDRFFENVVALRKDDFQYQFKMLNKPPNRDEWHTTPLIVTAYYNPALDVLGLYQLFLRIAVNIFVLPN